jgi:hypothetical protein
MNSRGFGRDLRLNTGDSLHHQGMSSGLAEQSRFEQKNVNLRSSASSSKFVAKSVTGASASRGSCSAIERIGLTGNDRMGLTGSDRIGLTGSTRSSRPSSPIVDEPFSPSTVVTNNGFFSPSIGSKGQHHHFGSSSNSSSATSAAAQRLNNAAANLKQISYSISSASGNSSGTQLNMFTNAKHMFGNRAALGLRSSSFDLDPLEMSFETLRLAARSARPEELGSIANGGATANPAVGSAFSKIAACMTELAEQFKADCESRAAKTNETATKHTEQQLQSIQSMQQLLHRSCNVLVYGQELQRNLATLLRNVGVLDLLMQLFADQDASNDECSNEDTADPLEPEVDELKSVGNEGAKRADSESSDGKPIDCEPIESKDASDHRRSSIDAKRSMANASISDDVILEQKQLATVRLLGDCLTTEIRTHLLDSSSTRLQRLVQFCAAQAKGRLDVQRERAAVHFLRPLLEHCEDTCRHVLLQWGALEALLAECRTADTCSLRSCVQALTNAALFGGDECQRRLLANDLLIWLFPLASHRDRVVKYFALLTLGILVANKELEAHVVKSGSLDLIHTLVLCSDPHEWAQTADSCINNCGFGQSKEWLRRLVVVLDCDREEAKSIAAFHFAMEAHLKKRFGNTVVSGRQS